MQSVRRMTTRQDQLVKLREAGLSYAEIGRSLGITRQRAEQIVKGNPRRRSDLESRVMLTTTDVAQLLNVHPNTVRRWNVKGELKAYRISSRGDRRFLPEDVDSFLKEAEID